MTFYGVKKGYNYRELIMLYKDILHPNDVLIVHLLIKKLKKFYNGLTINFTSWNFSIGYIIL